jgi:hypothetical protein
MSWFAGLFGYDEENAARAAAADATLARLNREKFDRGELTAEQFQVIEARRLQSQFDADAEVWGGFKDGLEEGRQNIQNTVKGGLNFGGSLLFGSIPWWVWLVAAAALFFWMGGASLLKGSLSRS